MKAFVTQILRVRPLSVFLHQGNANKNNISVPRGGRPLAKSHVADGAPKLSKEASLPGEIPPAPTREVKCAGASASGLRIWSRMALCHQEPRSSQCELRSPPESPSPARTSLQRLRLALLTSDLRREWGFRSTKPAKAKHASSSQRHLQ